MCLRSVAMVMLLVALRPGLAVEPEHVDWPSVGGDRGCMRYSRLTQINRSNVGRLKVAWTYETRYPGDKPTKTIECTPVVVDGTMYITTGHLEVVALDAASGDERWHFDPVADHPASHSFASGGVNRGVAYWSDGQPDGQRRILHGTSDGRLFSLDAATGKLDRDFGNGGIKDLREDFDEDLGKLSYGPTSAPAIYRDLVILGVSTGEGPGIAAPGDVRAFDVRTGEQKWRFHTVPRPGEHGHETWEGDSWQNRGGVNAWGGLSVDVERSMVFVGLGSAAFDFYGGDRKGQNLFANSTVALDARSGARLWHFQTLHHDLWDHDLPVYPNLVRVLRNGRPVDAVAQVTKTGYVYLFDRDTGQPLFEIQEKAVFASDVEGEAAAATQPIPVKPPPFSVQKMDESNVTNIGTANRDYVLSELKKIRSGPAFNPPSLQGTVVIPGYHGGANWSGACFDPENDLLYVNSNNVPNIITLQRAPESAKYRYQHTGYVQFRDQEGYPAIRPPWGQLTAIDLNRGDFRWQIPLGEYEQLTKRGVPVTGTETFGGAIVTAGGLIFIAGTKDEKFRAFDKETGKLLWQHQLAAGGYATPSTYVADGRQYVVIAAGGAGKLKTPAGNQFVAFALAED